MLLKITRTLLSLCLLFAMLYLGKGLSILLPIGIPDSIWGLLLLFTSLVIGIVKVEWVTPAARPLTRYMTIFFSTMVSLVLIGLFAQWVFHRK